MSALNSKLLNFQIYSKNQWISIKVNNTRYYENYFSIYVNISEVLIYNFTQNFSYECRISNYEDEFYYSNYSLIYSIDFSNYLTQFIKIYDITYLFNNSKPILNISIEINSLGYKLKNKLIQSIFVKTNQCFNLTKDQEIRQDFRLFNNSIILELFNCTNEEGNNITIRIDFFILSNYVLCQYFTMELPKTYAYENLNKEIILMFLIMGLISLIIVKRKKKCISMDLIDLDFN